MSDDWFGWAPKWQGRLKAFTLVSCGVAVIASATADWESQFGDQHCFHGVKPGLKRMFNNLFGVSEPSDASANSLGPAAAKP
jgi:hypothetical protein